MHGRFVTNMATRPPSRPSTSASWGFIGGKRLLESQPRSDQDVEIVNPYPRCTHRSAERYCLGLFPAMGTPGT